MKRREACAAGLGLFLAALPGYGAETTGKGKWSLTPFWKTSTMEDESLFFVREREGEPPRASLLFLPDRVLALKSASGLVSYQEGKDYRWSPGKREITLPGGSRIPFKRRGEMYPPQGAPQSIAGFRGGDSALFFGEGHVFHDLQAAATYLHHDRWTGYTPRFSEKSLPQTIGKLKSRAPFTLVLYGDSISEGYNASGFTKVAPYMPPYGQLLALTLEAQYRKPIRFANQSLAGKSTTWGVENIGKVAAEKPDLVLLAFGMNDASGNMPPEMFAANIRKMMGAVRKDNPSAEFILIATMTGNPEWTFSSPDLYLRYREALAELCGKGAALADLTAVWTEILKFKKFADITGNGVNHPNDFGHRLYAMMLAGLLVP
ncbi:MAG: SGNH/GDSL hydrolase family protein [Candidatus Latescibacterota bacterium]